MAERNCTATSSFVYPPSLSRRHAMDDINSNESQQDDIVTSIPKRQKEITKMKYIRRKRRVKRIAQKTQASSSDSEPTAAARQSLELFSLCNYSTMHSRNSPQSLFSNESFFSQQESSLTKSAHSRTNHCCPPALDVLDTAATDACWLQASLKFDTDHIREFDGRTLLDESTIVTPAAKANKHTNWYSNFFGGIFGYVANYIFNSKENTISDKDVDHSDFEKDFSESIEEMAEKVLQRVSQFCPEQYADELKERCIQPLQHKLNQRGVTIGICGQSQYGKKLLMKVLERRESDNGNVSYRLCFCPSIEDGTLSSVEANASHNYFLSEQATCAAYVYILSSEYEDSMDSLKWLIERDKDVLTQGRLLILATDDVMDNLHSSSSTDIPQHTLINHHPPIPTTTPTQSPVNAFYSNTTSPIITMPTGSIITQSTNHTMSPVTPPSSQSIHHTASPTITHHTIPTSTPYTAITQQDTSSHSILKDTSHTHGYVEMFHNRDQRLLSKMKIQSFVEEKIGIVIPKSCIILCPSEWMNITSKELNEESGDHGNNEESCDHGNNEESCDHDNNDDNNSEYDIESIFGFEDDKVESLANGEAGIGQWLKQFNINCDMLRQLSITSDTLHCIEHCSSKLQYQLDDLCGEIDRLERSMAHKNHLMMEMKQLWNRLEVQSKDAILYQELSSCYELDIDPSVRSIKEYAVDVLDRYQTVCLAKLESLSQTDSVSGLSMKDIYHLFKTDVDGFTSETVKCLNTFHSNVLFHNMHNTVKQRFNSIDELNTLRQLSESYLHSESNSEGSSPDCFVYHEDIKGSTLYYSCSLETIGCNDGYLKTAQVTDLLYSILLVLASKVFKTCHEIMIKTDLKKLTGNFINLCTQCLNSDTVRTKSVQYHVEMLSRLILSHAGVFKQHYSSLFAHLHHQFESNLMNVEQEHRYTELRFKHLINLKVYLELKKSFLSFCLT